MAEETAAEKPVEAPAPASVGGKKSSVPFILALIGGIFILLGGLAIAAIYAFLGDTLGAVLGSAGAEATAAMTTMGIAYGAVGIALGVIVMVGAMLMRKPEKAKMGSVIVLVLSIIALFVAGGGFLIGTILGIIGGALGLRK